MTLKDGQTIDGSAIRMAKLNFDCFHFIETEREKIESLAKKFNSSVKREKMRFYQEDLNSSLIKILEQIKLIEKGQEKPHRVLIFFDPYGLQVKWDTVEKIAQYQFVDVIYLFPSHSILRGIPHKFDGALAPDMREKIINVLGLDEKDIIDHFYSQSLQGSLFGETEVDRGADIDKVTKIFKDVKLIPTFNFVYTPKTNGHLVEEGKPTLFTIFLFSSNPSIKAGKLIQRLGEQAFKNID